MNDMGLRILQKRKEKDMTMEELGKAIGVNASAINKYEKGLVTNIKRETIKAMADIFDCSPSWLMFGDFEIVDETIEHNGRTYEFQGTLPINEINDAAMELYYNYLKADKKTRRMVDMLLNGDDEE